jgi:hypothetical protein
MMLASKDRCFMRGGRIRGRSYLDPITDRVRPNSKETASKLPGVILFAAVLGVAPLTFVFDWLLEGNWLVSGLSAIAVAAVLAVNAILLIRS